MWMKRRLLMMLGLGLCSIVLAGCATATDQNPDPYEKYNRSMYHFNATVDHLVAKPVAETYNTVVPQTVRTGVSNFFENVGQIPTIANDLLQGEIKLAALDLARFTLNTFLGLGGLIDVATPSGIVHHQQSFGMTLATWTGNGDQTPYLVVPFLGPSTVDGAVGLPADYVMNPIFYVEPTALEYGLTGLSLVSLRASYLENGEGIMSAMTLDPYIAQRNAYMQYWRNLVANRGKSTYDPSVIWKYSMEQQTSNAPARKPIPGNAEQAMTPSG